LLIIIIIFSIIRSIIIIVIAIIIIVIVIIIIIIIIIRNVINTLLFLANFGNQVYDKSLGRKNKKILRNSYDRNIFYNIHKM